MQLLWNYVKEYRKFLLWSLGLATVNQVFSLLSPQITRLIIDGYASHPKDFTAPQFLQGVFVLALGLVAVAFVSRVAKNFQDYYVNVITQRVSTKLYAHSVTHSFSLPYAVFEDQRSGELLQKLQKARNDSQIFIGSIINNLFLSLVTVLFVIVYAYIVHWVIGTVYLLLIPVVFMFNYFISRKIKVIQKTIIKQTADLAGSTTETLRNVELVKSLGLEEQEIKRLNSVNEQILNLELKKIRMVRVLDFMQGTLMNAISSGLTLLLIWMIFKEAISLGQYFTLFIYSFFVFGPLASLGAVATQYQETKASMEQLEVVLDIKAEEKPTNPVPLGPIKEVKFEDVTFQYSSADTPSVQDINLTLHPGETVAFVGPSGAGKSTVIKLLVGLYDPTGGQLLFNDIDIKTVDRAELRKRVGLVAQETQLFAGSIRDNLLFVNPAATDEDCLEALRHAAALTVVERGDQGLDTKIGEGGIKISGGERQRLAIARALLRKPELIIFDEATSSLDSITEKAITGTIKDIIKTHPDTMTVLVAHRLSTIAHAQTIYVLEKGRIVESGSHDALLEKHGLYAALWREQSAVNNEE